ncbi:Hypothetical protein HVR_LOCUS580 [uncultured virus]|nr:Hypothetical protein HVR_LOCUS580 [uncultured virus]
MNELLKSFGFRSIINSKTQTWGSFTSVLFSGDDSRGEFDVLEFVFDLDTDNPIQEDEEDDDSLDSAYFGRPIDHTTFHLIKTPKLEDKLQCIKNMLPSFFSRTGKNKLSEPILIISNIDDNTIDAYYIWQYK